MIIFALSTYYERFIKPICEENPASVVGDSEISRYPSGELHVIIHSDVNDKDCFIIGSIAPPDENIITLLMMTDALKRSGARSVQVFLPYLGYSRQDKFGQHESSGIALIGSLLKNVGVDEIITIDTHSDMDKKLIGLPFKSVPSSSLFISAIKELGWGDITIVAPDEGARVRAQAVSDLLGLKKPIAYMIKKHDDENIVHLDLIGKVGLKAIIIDDIIDGGRTVVSAYDLLIENGVKEVAVVATHGLFTDGAWNQLTELGIKSIFVSDSCPEVFRQANPIVHIVSLDNVIPMIMTETIKRGRII